MNESFQNNNTEQKSWKDTRGEKVRDALSWVEENISKVESLELQKANIQVFSNENFNESDISFVTYIKDDLDSSEQAPTKATVMILGEKEWQEFMKRLGRDSDEQKFTGRSEENPIVPIDMSPFIVIPSSDVFKKETPYRKIYELGKTIKTKIQSDNEHDSNETYRVIYLRNMLSHELSHLYQFSERDVNDILDSNDDDFSKKFNQLLPAREFLSIAYALFQMKKISPENYDAYLETAEAITIEEEINPYAKEQARRTLDAANLLKSMKEEEVVAFLKNNFKILQGHDTQAKIELQKTLH